MINLHNDLDKDLIISIKTITLNEFINKPIFHLNNANNITRQRIKCVNGFTVSIQADEYKYCNPRNNFGPWIEVELGYPSAKMSMEINKFAEDPDQLLNTVYGYVPIDIVQTYLTTCGGIIEPT